MLGLHLAIQYVGNKIQASALTHAHCLAFPTAAIDYITLRVQQISCSLAKKGTIRNVIQLAVRLGYPL